MKERPILMSTENVKAILEGHKTQTRRVIKPQPRRIDNAFDGTWEWKEKGHYHDDLTLVGVALKPHCPYGQVGNKLWVRETWAIGAYLYERYAEIYYKAENYKSKGDRYFKHIDWNNYLTKKLGTGGVALAGWDNWHPSIHMPRWASRITLEITGIRVERLQEITEDDAQAEGIKLIAGTHRPYDPKTLEFTDIARPITHRYLFAGLWDSINGKKHPWSSNPFVWVISFRRLE